MARAGTPLDINSPCEEYPEILLDSVIKSFWEKRADDYMDERIVLESE